MEESLLTSSNYSSFIKREETDRTPFLSTPCSSMEWNDDMNMENDSIGSLFPSNILGDEQDLFSLLDTKSDLNFDLASSPIHTPTFFPELLNDQKGVENYINDKSDFISEFPNFMDQNNACANDTSLDYGEIMSTEDLYGDAIKNSDEFDEVLSACRAKELSAEMAAVAPSSIGLPALRGDPKPDLSPASSNESWDSGVSAGESSPPECALEHRLSLDRERGWSASPPSSSPSSQYSRSSSATLSPAPSSHITPPHLSPSTSPTHSHPNITRNATPSLIKNNIIQSTSSSASPQFVTQKRPRYTFTTTNSNNATIVDNINTISGKPITILTTTPNAIKNNNINPVINRVTPTIINRSQFVTKINDNSVKNNANAKLSPKSSPSPSVVTLSGVNKTSGIIKSPAVISVSRKHTLGKVISSSNNSGTNCTVIGTALNQAPKQVAVISPSGEIIGNTSIANGAQVFKTVTVSSGNGRFNTGNAARFTTANGQQIIFAQRGVVSGLPAGKIVKSGQNILVPFDPKTMEKLRTIKIVSNRNGNITSASGVRALSTSSTTGATILRTNTTSVANSVTGASNSFVTSNRPRTIGIAGLTGMSRPGGCVSILKNMCLSSDKSEGFASLVATPKEESLDSDDDMELPKNNQPLVLTEEEQKLVAKENVKLPSHYPLTKRQERDLKRIKRKIRNKISAQDSRKRKKEYMDKLEEKINLSYRENERLKLQVATLEESNKKLSEQLQKFQELMNSQAAPTVTPNISASHHNHHHHNTRQQHPSAFLLMMILSAALFIYPSVLPQGKGGGELLATVAHKMPAAGNSRSLLEAATAKLSVCQEGDNFGEELKLESSSVTKLDVLNDHDYAPPMKRGRFDLSVRGDDFCMKDFDDHLPPPRKKEKLSTDELRSTLNASPTSVDIKEESLSPPPLPEEPTSEGILGLELADKKEALGGDSDYFKKLRDTITSALISGFTKHHNRTVPPNNRGLAAGLASQLIVELEGKRFRDDLELE
ncbi:uncharacterized protein LOC108677630 [Hyalella azteca]|uniref:Uncharacterized protein LOC108677630 n=1 Tax=Hyalella azteca TaxID=294128 RepID=A0A8B7P884_HYAAZ|nr:uncharacterized protein LOC108677630 [Hyalella azteca]